MALDSPEFSAEILAAENTLTFSDGSIRKFQTDNPYFPLSQQSLRQALRAGAGLAPTQTPWEDEHRGRPFRSDFLVGVVSDALLEKWQGETAVLTSSLQLRFGRLRVGATLPLHRGAHWANDGVRLQLLSDPHWGNDRLELPLLHSRATSLLHPIDRLGADPLSINPFYGFALINRAAGEVCLAVQFVRPNSSVTGASFEQRIMRLRFHPVQSLHPESPAPLPAAIDDDWLAGAELVIFVNEFCGESTQHLTFGAVSLPPPSAEWPVESFLHD